MGINFVTRFAELRWIVRSAEIDEATKGKYLAQLAKVEKMSTPGFLTRLFSPAMAAREEKIAAAMARLDREIRALPTSGALDRNAARFADSGTLALGEEAFRLPQQSQKESFFAIDAVLLPREESLGAPIVIDLSNIADAPRRMQFDIGRGLQYGVNGSNDYAKISVTKDASVSRGEHVVITYDPVDRSVKISDRHSSNGTFVGGERIFDRWIPLDQGDIEVRAGTQRIVIKSRELPAEPVIDTGPKPCLFMVPVPAELQVGFKMEAEIGKILSKLGINGLRAEVSIGEDVVVMFTRKGRPNSGLIKLIFPKGTSSEEIGSVTKNIFENVNPFSRVGNGDQVTINFVSNVEMESLAPLFRTDMATARRNGLVRIGYRSSLETSSVVPENGVMNLLGSPLESADGMFVEIYANQDILGAVFQKVRNFFAEYSSVRSLFGGYLE